MRLEILPDQETVARRAAEFIAAAARAAVAERGRFLIAVSGGATPLPMLRALAGEKVPWGAVHVFQVDERVAPPGDPDRNLTQLREALVSRVALPPTNLHVMEVENADIDAAAESYARDLAATAGAPVTLDLVHLGLGSDGHTASLIPGDPVLDVTDCDVATTGEYQGRIRMTLTYPVIDQARQILWIVTGAEKASALARLVSGDRTIPAGRVRTASGIIFADEAAAAKLVFHRLDPRTPRSRESDSP